MNIFSIGSINKQESTTLAQRSNQSLQLRFQTPYANETPSNHAKGEYMTSSKKQQCQNYLITFTLPINKSKHATTTAVKVSPKYME